MFQECGFPETILPDFPGFWGKFLKMQKIPSPAAFSLPRLMEFAFILINERMPTRSFRSDRWADPLFAGNV